MEATSVKHVYTLTQAFPDEESFALTAQLRRTAISVPSNVEKVVVEILQRTRCRHVGARMNGSAILSFSTWAVYLSKARSRALGPEYRPAVLRLVDRHFMWGCAARYNGLSPQASAREVFHAEECLF